MKTPEIKLDKLEKEETEDKVIAAYKWYKKRRKLILAAIAFVLILAVVLTIWISLSKIKKLKEENAILKNAQELTKQIDISILNEEIHDIGELATIEYFYTDAASYSDSKEIGDVTIPFTQKSYVIKWDGTIKAGVEVNEIKAVLKESSKQLVIQMPTATILSHELDENSYKVLEEKNNIFNPIKLEDRFNTDIEAKAKMEQHAIENGLLDKALDNAKVIIENLVYTDVVKDAGYTIEFEMIEE